MLLKSCTRFILLRRFLCITKDQRKMEDIIRHDLKNYAGASNLVFNQKVKELRAAGQNIYHFAFGESPFPPPERFKEFAKTNIERAEYLPVAGLLNLREAIAGIQKRWNDLNYDPSSVVVGPGSKELIYLVLAVVNADVLIPMPSWTSYKSQCQLLGKQTFDVPSTFEDRYWFTADTLEAVAKQCNKKHKVLILNSPNNPSGLTLKAEQMMPICDVCRRNNILIISDEIYSQLAFDGNHESIAKYYAEGTIVTSGFSKWSSIGGWRVGYALFPPTLSHIQHAVTSAGSNTYSCAPAPFQHGIAQALENIEEMETYIFHARRILKAVAEYAYRKLLNAGCRTHQSEAAYYFMPDFEFLRPAFEKRGIHDGQAMCDTILKEANVALLPCGPDFVRRVGEYTVRFCYINFDGKAALEASKCIPSEKHLGDEFVIANCMDTVAGIKALIAWINDQKKLL